LSVPYGILEFTGTVIEYFVLPNFGSGGTEERIILVEYFLIVLGFRLETFYKRLIGYHAVGEVDVEF